MQLRAEEISSIIKKQIQNYEKAALTTETGTVLSVGDGIARVYGLESAMSGELLEFPGNLMGLVLNLEADTVGAVCFGEVANVKEGSVVKRTGRILDVPVGEALVGRKGRDYLGRRKADVVHDFVRIYDGLDLEKARLVSKWLVPRYEKGEWDAVYVVYNEFKSAITQKVTLEPLLPLPPPAAGVAAAAEKIGPSDFIYEPNQRALLERLVPMYVEISIYRALLESQASFFGAQMTAMDAATRNAKEMIARYTLVYNRARQAAITKELMEIIGGAEALKD